MTSSLEIAYASIQKLRSHQIVPKQGAPPFTIPARQPVIDLPTPELNDDDIVALLNLQYHNTTEFIFMDDNEMVLELISMLTDYNPQLVYYFLYFATSRQYIFFQQPALKQARDLQRRRITMNTTDAKIIPGLARCKKCGSDKVRILPPIVNRAMDEPMSNPIECTVSSCKHKDFV